jgi:hypothetical protein
VCVGLPGEVAIGEFLGLGVKVLSLLRAVAALIVRVPTEDSVPVIWTPVVDCDVDNTQFMT